MSVHVYIKIYGTNVPRKGEIPPTDETDPTSTFEYDDTITNGWNTVTKNPISKFSEDMRSLISIEFQLDALKFLSFSLRKVATCY